MLGMLLCYITKLILTKTIFLDKKTRVIKVRRKFKQVINRFKINTPV